MELFKDTSSDADELKLLFREVLDETPNSYYVVIDGFDEVPRAERDTVLTTLGQITSFSLSRVKIFLSSRQDIGKEIDMNFQNCQKKTTGCPEVYADITTYINVSIEERQGKGDLVIGNPTLVSAVKEALINGANGMYVITSMCSHPLQILISIGSFGSTFRLKIYVFRHLTRIYAK